MTTTLDPPAPATAVDRPDPRRFRALGVIAVAQLMIVLDATVVTIALPSAQRALHISVANRQWVMTAYTLAFGGLLLLGGRIADYLGRKRMFVLSLLGFAAASALGGLAQSSAMLFGARALQGAMAAVMAPSALSLITVTFTEPKERARAFGVYGGISGGGAAIGLILGGLLTQYVSWRWTLLINTPIAVLTAFFALRLVGESKTEHRGSYDVAGAVTATAGLLSLVYGFTRAQVDGWGASDTLAFVAAGVALLAAFLGLEARSRNPLLPLRVMADRNRGGSFLASLLVGIAMFATFLFLTYYFQLTLHYSAIRSGFAFLPFSVGIISGAGVASRFLPRVGPRPLMVGGLALGAIGLSLFTFVSPTSSYLVHVLPAELIVSLGMGMAFVPFSSTALVGVDPADAGVASALVSTTQQTGGSLGVALLNTVAASATTSYLTAHHFAAQVRAAAVVRGYTTAFTISAALMALAMVVSLVLVRGIRQAGPGELPEPVFEPELALAD
ncbi:MAG TPA: MFS transporter [Acidimicrobiales bacterium]|nr:MFS transporter [Acidimicrobiales bacterium]